MSVWNEKYSIILVIHAYTRNEKREGRRALSGVPELIQIVSSEKYDWMKRHTHAHAQQQQLHSTVQANVSHYEINANKFSCVWRESIVSDAKMWATRIRRETTKTLLAQLNWFQFSMHLCRIKLFLWAFCSFVSFSSTGKSHNCQMRARTERAVLCVCSRTHSERVKFVCN